MIEVRGEHKGYVNAGTPTELEIHGLKHILKQLVDKYTTQRSNEITFSKKDYTYQDRHYEIVLENHLQAGFLKETQYIDSVFLNQDKKVLCKVYDEIKDDYVFYEITP